MSYYDNITLTARERLGDVTEVTGSGFDVSYARPIMGAFRSRLESSPDIAANIILVLKIELPRATPNVEVAGTSDFPYNHIEIKGVIHKVGQQGDAYIPQPFYHRYTFSNSEGTNITFVGLNNYTGVNTAESPYLNGDGGYISVNTPSLTTSTNNTLVINFVKNPTTLDTVLFIKGTYLLI